MHPVLVPHFPSQCPSEDSRVLSSDGDILRVINGNNHLALSADSTHKGEESVSSGLDSRGMNAIHGMMPVHPPPSSTPSVFGSSIMEGDNGEDDWEVTSKIFFSEDAAEHGGFSTRPNLTIKPHKGLSSAGCSKGNNGTSTWGDSQQQAEEPPEKDVGGESGWTEQHTDLPEGILDPNGITSGPATALDDILKSPFRDLSFCPVPAGNWAGSGGGTFPSDDAFFTPTGSQASSSVKCDVSAKDRQGDNYDHLSMPMPFFLKALKTSLAVDHDGGVVHEECPTDSDSLTGDSAPPPVGGGDTPNRFKDLRTVSEPIWPSENHHHHHRHKHLQHHLRWIWWGRAIWE